MTSHFKVATNRFKYWQLNCPSEYASIKLSNKQRRYPERELIVVFPLTCQNPNKWSLFQFAAAVDSRFTLSLGLLVGADGPLHPEPPTVSTLLPDNPSPGSHSVPSADSTHPAGQAVLRPDLSLPARRRRGGEPLSHRARMWTHRYEYRVLETESQGAQPPVIVCSDVS